MPRPDLRPAALAAAALLGGCSLAPAYRPPVTAAPAAFREADGWALAAPADAVPRGAWWSVYRDPVLDDLEARLDRASPTLAAALARFDAARAAARGAAAELYPTVTAAASASRERVSGLRPLGGAGSAQTFDDFSVGGLLGYELDLWGRVRDTVRAARAEAQASGADLAAVRLSLQASLADAYVRLRGLDAQAELLRQAASAFARFAQLTRDRHDGGIASGLEVGRAEAQLGDARAQLSDVANQRAATDHEIAALVGELASATTVPVAVLPLEPPRLAAGTPAALLQRRPDVARAERRVAAANARIGVARAAFFPQVTLGASAGSQATALGGLLSAPATYWALGPLQAALAVFDGGRRRADLAISRAQYDEAAATYRETVLAAFREAEDALAATRLLAVQADDQRAAAAAARHTGDLALIRYKDGASTYLDVVTAQTAALDSQRALLVVQTQRVRTSVALIRAIGGPP